MDLNKTNKIILVAIAFVIFVAILIGLYLFIFPKSQNQNAPEVVYSSDPTESKNLLVPKDFPFEENVDMKREFQRNSEGFLEYTAIWTTNNEREENLSIFQDYMEANNWNPFILNISKDLVSITGEKGNVVLNIFIGLNNDIMKDQVQVHFSQK